MSNYQTIQHNLMTRFKRSIWSRFAKAITEYQLINHHDKIAVCISGGKDSFLMAFLFNELLKHKTYDFEVVFLCMDPGYSEANRNMIEENAKLLQLPVTIFETNIFDEVYQLKKLSCYRCATKRRGSLYHMAQSLGCNKIALGHHFNDVIETVMMNQLINGQYASMMPKLTAQNYENMELIRPLYLVKEHDINNWVKENELTFLKCACRFTQLSCHDTSSSKRAVIKQVIEQLKTIDVDVDQHIFNATQNVKMDKLLGYYDLNNEFVSFLDDYNQTFRLDKIVKTEYSLKQNLERAKKDIELFLELKKQLFNSDVSLNLDFQRKYNGFYKMRQRPAQFYEFYYDYFEKNKNNQKLKIEDIVLVLYHQFHRVEMSFASKMLNMINDNYPIWDKNIIARLEIKLPKSSDEAYVMKMIDCYYQQVKWMNRQVIDSPLIQRFNQRYPQIMISDIKKLDLLLRER